MSSDPAKMAKYELRKLVTTCMHSDILIMEKHTETRAAAEKLRHHYRDEIVVTEEGRGIGMVTDKDILRKVGDITVYAESTMLVDVMSSPLVTIRDNKSLRDALTLMNKRHCRKLPVSDRSGHILGIIYKSDILVAAERSILALSRGISPWGKAIIGNLGFVLQFAGILMIVPALVATFLGDTITATGIYLSMVLLLSTGFFLNSYGEKAKMDMRQASILVLSSLFILSLFGTVPYLYVPPGMEYAEDSVVAAVFFSMREGQTSPLEMFSGAFFSSAAGFTTGGISLYETPEDLPQSFTFYRSYTQLVGGMSFIYLVITAFYPSSRLEGMRSFITGKELHLRELFSTITAIFAIYIVVVAALLYILGDNNILDDFSLAMSTLATGGFVPDSGMVQNMSWPKQGVLVAAMILGALPFTFHHAFVTRKLRPKLGKEVLAYFTLLVSAILLFSIVGGLNALESVFYPISASTTAGLQISSLESLPIPGQYILIILMLVGGCGFSTAGGIKVFRIFHMTGLAVYLRPRYMRNNIRRILRLNKTSIIAWSRHIRSVDPNGNSRRQDILYSIIVIAAFPFIAFLTGSYLVTFEGANPDAAFFDAVGVITTGGLSAGVIDFDTSVHTKILLSALMIFGRLEIIALIYLIIPPIYTAKH